jgi:hypothetical protein
MVTLDLVKGGSAVVLETDGDRVTLLSSLSSPPGSTLELSLEGESFRVKVRGCKKTEPVDDAGRSFRIEGRWVSLSRGARAKVTGISE